MAARSPTAGLARAALALALALALVAAAAAHAGAHAAARGLDEEAAVQASSGRQLLFGRGIGLGIREGIRALVDVLPELFSSLG